MLHFLVSALCTRYGQFDRSTEAVAVGTYRRHGAPGLGRAARRFDGLLGLRRAGGDRLDRLYGPGELRHQHPGRGQVRLRPALGGVARQRDRDAVPGPVGQARHRHRPQPRGIVPRSFSAAGRLGDVDRQRDRRHGDRSRRISRRRHRTCSAVAHAAVRRNGGHRSRNLRSVDVRSASASGRSS